MGIITLHTSSPHLLSPLSSSTPTTALLLTQHTKGKEFPTSLHGNNILPTQRYREQKTNINHQGLSSPSKKKKMYRLCFPSCSSKHKKRNKSRNRKKDKKKKQVKRLQPHRTSIRPKNTISKRKKRREKKKKKT